MAGGTESGLVVYELRESMLFSGRILPATSSIAERWGVLEGQRQLAGRPLHAPDGMIAATALEHGLTLVTRNTKDFESLGVTLINPWLESEQTTNIFGF